MEGNSFILEGTWKGKGQVTDKISYEEELTITKLKPILYSISQSTWNKDIGPLHKEVGYIKLTGDNKVELVLAHPFGATEISEGCIEDNKVTLKTKSVARTSSATQPHVISFTRVYCVDDGVLTYDMYLATNEYKEERH